MITLVVDGISYQYPQVDDEDWGNQATLWASSVSDVLATLRSPTLPTATSGKVRLGNTDRFSWRGFGNTFNVDLYVDVDDKLYVKIGSNPAIDLTSNAAGNVTGPLSATDNALARYDGTTGQIIQNSGAILDDSNNLTGLASVDATTVKQGGSSLVNLFIAAVTTPTDNAIVRFDGTGGKTIQNSGATIDDSGNLAAVGITASGNLSAVDVSASGALSFGTINSTNSNKVIDAYTRSTGTTVGARGIAVAASSGSFTTTSTNVLVTNQTLVLTSGGRPIEVWVESVSTVLQSNIFVAKNGSSSVSSIIGNFTIKRDGTAVYTSYLQMLFPSDTSTDHLLAIPPSGIRFTDVVGAGTYTYTLVANAGTASTLGATLCRLVVKET